MNPFELLGRVIVLPVNLAAKPLVENIRLRAEVRDLTAEVDRFVRLTDELQAERNQLARVASASTYRLARVINHANRLATSAREDAEIVAAARAVLADAVDDVIAHSNRPKGDR